MTRSFAVRQAMVVYKITYPKERSMSGSTLPGPCSPSALRPTLAIAMDFTPEQRWDFTIRKEILWDPRMSPSVRRERLGCA
jgi:hypothetical protein